MCGFRNYPFSRPHGCCFWFEKDPKTLQKLQKIKPSRNSSLAAYVPPKILVFETPMTPLEFPVTIHRVGMDVFWNLHTMMVFEQLRMSSTQ